MRLTYVKHHFGPYATNLTHVLRTIEGHFISGYADGGDAPDKQLELVPGAVEDAETSIEQDISTRDRFTRVVDLVAGFETPFGLELLTTVHWVATRQGARTADEAVALTHQWNDRKLRFSDRQIRLAMDVLKTKGWLSFA